MNLFRDPEAADRAIKRLEELTEFDLRSYVLEAFKRTPDPDLALTNLERWLRNTSSPRLHMEQMVGLPRLGGLLAMLLGASQPLADSLIQNPELASLVLEPGELARIPTREDIVAEGRRLLTASSSHSHSLDRLRYLKQRWSLPIVMNDLIGSWPQETVWLVLSDLADALIQLAAETVWKETRKLRDVPEECPVLIAAFGKLGGHELNYSSDVDLVYAVMDGTDERLERECTRFCEALGRALSDRMGRGSLFRVDLRLRPYGGAGPILRSMKSVEIYYDLYAEQWEVQALLRSRAVFGPAGLADRWEQMRLSHCFRPHVSDYALEQMLSMRQRIEEHGAGNDLKRGSGGIRDVEFLTQVLQLLHGNDNETLRIASTCDALRAIETAGILDHVVVNALITGYTFLRKLEHRTQLVRDRQTHAVPEDEPARLALARSMDLAEYADLEKALNFHRRTVQSLYRSTLQIGGEVEGDRSTVAKVLGANSAAVLQWFDVLPESTAFYKLLCENDGSLERVQRIVLDAPRLIPFFKSSLSLTELLMSGEIEEVSDVAARVAAVPLDAPATVLAKTYASAYAATLARWVLNPHAELGISLCQLMEALLAQCFARVGGAFDVLALGSFGTMELSPGSDADLLLLVSMTKDHPQAEAQGQKFLGLLGEMRRAGVQIEIDLRLRPEGGKGLLVRTYSGLKAYDLDGMEMWERFALGHARLLRGNDAAIELVRHCAYAMPLTPERLRELVVMKTRIENERLDPKYKRRNVKLGNGGLNDIEWLVHLNEMRYPNAAQSGTTTEMGERIRNLGRARLINALETEALLEARTHLLEVRARLFLLGLTDDIVPENPDKLGRLAHAMGFADCNRFLARHEQIIGSVRTLLEEGLERLHA